MSARGSETRKEPRFLVDWPATVRLSGFTSVKAEVRDVGPHGIGLAMPAGIAAAQESWVMLGTALGPVLGKAKLRWQIDGGGNSRAGAIFEPHPGYSSVRFAQALELLARESPPSVH